MDNRTKPSISVPKWLFIVLLTVAGILLLLFIKHCNRPLPPKPDIIPVKEIKQQVAAADTLYKQQERKWQEVADSAIAAAMEKETSLNLAQANARELERRLLLFAKELKNIPLSEQEIFRAVPQTEAGNDYSSASDDIASMVQNSIERDSLCNSAISNLGRAITAKDSLLAARDSLDNSLRRALGTALDNQTKLEVYSKQLRKAAKRSRFGSGVWKVVATGLAGVLVYKSLR